MTTTGNTAHSPATPATDGPGSVTRDLRLLSVLESGLPTQLGTPDEPAAYTVPAVFSRQVSHDERARIEAPATAQALAAQIGAPADGPTLRLVVSDRRLLIENTTLAQLHDGLAAALAAMLRDLGRDLRAQTSERAVEAEALAVGERRRAAATHTVAESIRFV
ncbi:hypothetical protein Celgi_2904 [Cellulomonas gilvus ATCC 13127]|uniref:Uncharacterized protein n=1 Tax=Cellulomonas gilvus (strain ATCC 13127 / NRRL B-14078) TaxID=593907 RepID=F8A5V7_CELGA|nr:hypothetical protein Celgi_2904 [Cellulomonas gilvus ATCC 13127]